MSNTQKPFGLIQRAEYAEDQEYAPVILTTHVLHRGFQSGVAVGLVIGAARVLYFRLGSAQHPSAAATVGQEQLRPAALRKSPRLSATGTFLHSAARGGLITSLAMSLALPLYIRYISDGSNTQIVWQDRAYRLLHNEGQMKVDKWSVAGMMIGAVSHLSSPRYGPTALTLLGRLGIGSLAGVLSMEAWDVVRSREKGEMLPKKIETSESGPSTRA